MKTNASQISFDTKDGTWIGARWYEPEGRARATVVIHGATATPQRYYAPFASALTERGLRVLTYDYRGIGESRPRSLRRYRATMTEWAREDAQAAMDVASAFPEPILLVGHSFGGQLLGLIDLPDRVRSIVLVGAQLGYLGHWPLEKRIAYWPLWNAVIPATVATFGYQPGFLGLGVDLPGGVALEWARWCKSPNYLFDHHPEARARFASIDRPVLFYSFTDDSYAPKAAVSAYLAKLERAPVVHRRFAPSMLGQDAIDHFGFFRRGVVPSLWEEAIGFMDDALSGRRSKLGPKTPWEIELEEIEADLAYGRA